MICPLGPGCNQIKVALFKSMAAAVDWANSVTIDKEITSGSFQVTEVAPSMRRAFEREVSVCRRAVSSVLLPFASCSCKLEFVEQRSGSR